MTEFPRTLPAPRTPDPRDAPSLRWGVVGTGWIAERFVAALLAGTGQRVAAVASRSLPRAERFVRENAPAGAVAYGRYEQLYSDPQVDVVYVATPHTEHLGSALDAIAHGKHVLVEKPIGLDAVEAARVRDEAEAAGVFCAEALWSAFLPKFDVIRQLLEDGVLGSIQTVQAEVGERLPESHRIFDPSLAGGPLLDLGTYPVALATAVLGDPDTVVARGIAHPLGVLAQVGAVLGYPGAQAVLHSTLAADTPVSAVVAGERATIVFPRDFYLPGDFELRGPGGRVLQHSEPAVRHESLHFEAAEVARCIAEGRTETPLRRPAESVLTLTVMDAIRREAGDRHPERA
ncbi:Gfo/Idh/MocA family oxidoreductase [Herbiconiux sp. KACC 21604]|uniref:Gfo/Idh/MocA family protein n=1 Tax=unclassified Herbiconiux TaxID=2618217 RepID=UPI001491EAB5|nr:Gfo/Idh/MocA family oxidoreductase [Herbiconiux sp. SALV-R1]QJU55246.1 Gfo/Idh/MocA family oxidoreductase [Herbiconiux sp. SALV-R1]WPO86413.1 Gfo/Idh/MocA family oxidoreductase [Herbiconiux sp. KACC 21604]